LPEKIRRAPWSWVILLMVVGIVVGLIISSRMNLPPIGMARPAFKPSPELAQMSGGIADVAAYVTPSVVNISTSKTVQMRNPLYPYSQEPFFRQFFGVPYNEPRYRKFKERSLGSGVIVSADGYILTNNHVVAGAQEITVVLANKNTYKGRVVGTDPRSDIAVVKIDPKGLPAISFGDSDKLRPGDMVLAIGSPFGLAQTVTMGIVSAVGRVNVGIEDYEDFIQTDAAINPGNSGGALVNMKGELIGINTAIFSRTGGYMGIGFAIPSNMARNVMDSLIKTGKVERGWLGVSVQDLTSDLAAQFGVPMNEGALVAEVVKGSPAYKAGLKLGDVIVEFGEKPVEDSGQLRNLAGFSAVGSTVNLVIIRNRKRESVEVKIGELPKNVPAMKPVEPQ
jgi:serine protease Do